MTNSRQWKVLAALWIAALLLLVGWLLITPVERLRGQLRDWQFWSLELCFALVLVFGGVIAGRIRRELDRRDALALTAVTTLAIVLTTVVAPRTNRIYYDEQIYQSIGQNLSDQHRAQMCNDGIVEYGRLLCVAGEYNKQPYAYPHLLSVAYRVAGVNPAWAFVVNAAIMAMTVWAVYFAAWFLLRDRLAAFFGALIVTLIPQQILWSATAAAEPSASLACMLAVAAVAYFTVSRRSAALAFAAATTAYAVQFRPESILILPVLGLILLVNARDEWRRPRLWWAGLLFLALVTVHIGHTFAVRNEGWGTADARLSLGYVASNLAVNGRFYLADERFPVAFTLLAGFGLFAKSPGRGRLAFAVYFLAFFGIFLLFYAGSYNYGADVRYSLMTYPPLAALAGLGAARASRWAVARGWTRSPQLATSAALVFQFLWYAPVVRATTEEAWAARTDVRFAELHAPGLRGNTYVLTHNPNMFHVWGVNAGQMSMVLNNPTYLDYLATRYAGGVYFHWNFWCNVQVPAQQEMCRQSLDARPSVLLHEFRERDQRFALYRFVTAP